jgi:hypothetical protein
VKKRGLSKRKKWLKNFDGFGNEIEDDDEDDNV